MAASDGCVGAGAEGRGLFAGARVLVENDRRGAVVGIRPVGGQRRQLGGLREGLVFGIQQPLQIGRGDRPMRRVSCSGWSSRWARWSAGVLRGMTASEAR